jgi:hypothetical protein
MKLVALAAVLLLISAVTLAQTPPGGATPPSTSGTPSTTKGPAGDGTQQGAAAKPANSCSKPGLGTCKGCSITCAENQRPVCSEALYNWNSDMCTRDANCRCRVKR